MSIFTKIFVVLVMLLSVVLVALVVPYVTNRETFRSEYETQRRLRVAAEAAAANREKDIKIALDSKAAEVTHLQSDIQRLQTEVADKVATMQRLGSQIVKLEADNSGYLTQLSRLSSAMDQNQRILDIVQAEVVERRAKMLELEQRATELAAELNNRTVQRNTLEQLGRLNKEQIEELQSQIEELGSQVAAGGKTAAATPVPGGIDELTPTVTPEALIQGRITAVEKIADQTYVELSVGSNDKVRQGMKFTIHRDANFVAEAMVTVVDRNASAARITIKSETADVAINDLVFAGGL